MLQFRRRQAGQLLSFDTRAAGDTWDTLRTQFPEGWEPDALVLYLPFQEAGNVEVQELMRDRHPPSPNV